MTISLQRSPVSARSSTWERLVLMSDDRPGEIIEHCRAFALYHNDSEQTLIFDVSSGFTDAPLLGVYWILEDRLQILQNLFGIDK